MPDFDKDMQPILSNKGTKLPNLDNPASSTVDFSLNTVNNDVTLGARRGSSSEDALFGKAPIITPMAPTVSEKELYENRRYGTYSPFISDIEDQKANAQSWSDKAVNGTLKGLNLVGTTVAGGFGMMYGIAKAPFTGRLADIWDNEAMRGLDEWNTKVDQEYLPNYQTNAERDAAWYDTDYWLRWNFLFDMLVKNAGFAVGSMVSGNIINAGLRGAGRVAGALAANAAKSTEGFKLISPLLRNTSRVFSQGKNLEAAAVMESRINTIADLTEQSSKLAQIAKTTNKIAGFSDNTRRTIIATYSSGAEASWEALSTGNELRETLIEDYKNNNGGLEPTGEALKSIDAQAEAVGKASFFGNLALLGITEFKQLPRLLGSSYAAERKAANAYIGATEDIVLKDGKYVAKSGTGFFATNKFGRLSNRAYGLSKYVFDPKESAQEIGQYALQVGAQNYYRKAYQTQDADVLVDGFLYGLLDETKGALYSKEGITGGILGGLTGGLMQARSNYTERRDKKTNTSAFINQLNSTPSAKQAFQDKLRSANRDIILQEEHQQAVLENNKLEAKDLESDMSFNYLSSRIKYGRFDMVMEDIADIRQELNSANGLGSLKEQGIGNTEDTVETLNEKLNILEKSARNTNELYNSLNLRYGGIYTKDKQRVYTDEVIEKMAYAAYKVSDYDLRIGALSGSLLSRGIDLTTARELIFQTASATEEPLNQVVKDEKVAEAVSQVVANIDALSITDDAKDQLRADVFDVLEMGLRRKAYLEEYNAISKNPEKYKEFSSSVTKNEEDDKEEGEEEEGEFTATGEALPASALFGGGAAEAPAPVKVKVTTKLGEKELEVDKQYFVGSLSERDEKGNKVQKFDKVVIKKENPDGTLTIVDQDGNETFVSKDIFKAIRVVENADGRMELMENLTDEAYAKLNSIRTKIVEKTDELNKIAEQIKDIQNTQKQGGDTSFSKVFSAASSGLTKLSSMQKSVEDELAKLSAEQDDIVFALQYFKSFAEELETREEDFEALEKELRQQTGFLEDILKENKAQFDNLSSLADTIKRTIKDLASVIKQAIKKFDQDPPITIMSSLNKVIETGDASVELPNIKSYITDFALDKDLKEALSINKTELQRLQKLQDDLQALKEDVANVKRDYAAKKTLLDAILASVENFRKAKEEEAAILADEELQNTFTAAQENNSTESGSPIVPPTAGEEEEVATEDRSKPRKLIEVLFSATVDSTVSKRASDERHNLFLGKIDLLPDSKRDNIYRIFLTENNAVSLNLQEVIDKYKEGDKAGFVPKAGEERILAVYVLKDKDGFKLIDVNGKPVGKLGERVDPDVVIYSTMPSTKLEDSFGIRYVKEKTTPSIAAAYQAEWTKKRETILSFTNGHYPAEKFFVSRGFVEKLPKEALARGERSYIVGSLVTEEQINNGKKVVKVSTTGSIASQDTAVPVAPGRIVVVNGATVERVYTRQLTPKEAITAFEVLKKFVKKANKEKTFDTKMMKFLQGILYFESPYTKNADGTETKKEVSPNQIYFRKGYLHFGKDETAIPFSESAISANEARLMDFLNNTYHQANNSLISSDSSFTEFFIDDERNLQEKEWPSYQHYLIVPDGRSRQQMPLYSIARELSAKVPNDTNIKNRYSYNPNLVKVDVAYEAPPAPKPAPVVMDIAPEDIPLDEKGNPLWRANVPEDQLTEWERFRRIQYINTLKTAIAEANKAAPANAPAAAVTGNTVVQTTVAVAVGDFYSDDKSRVFQVTKAENNKLQAKFVNGGSGNAYWTFDEFNLLVRQGTIKLHGSAAPTEQQVVIPNKNVQGAPQPGDPVTPTPQATSIDADEEVTVVGEKLPASALFGAPAAPEVAPVTPEQQQKANERLERARKTVRGKIIKAINDSAKPVLVLKDGTRMVVNKSDLSYDENNGTVAATNQDGTVASTVSLDVVKEVVDSSNNKSMYRGGAKQYRVMGSYSYAMADAEKERKFIQERTPFSVSIVDNLIEAGNGIFAWGSYQDALITLYNQMEIGTGYHEMFEGVFDVFLSNKEKAKIFKEFTSRKGTFVDRMSGQTIPYKDATVFQAKEQMAEEYRDKVLYDLDPPVAKTSFIKQFFQDLINFINAILTGEIKGLNDLFGRMNAGFYKNTPFKNAPTTQLQAREKVGTFDAADTNTVVRNVVSRVFQTLFEENDASAINNLDVGKAKDVYNQVFDELNAYFTIELRDQKLDEGMSEQEYDNTYTPVLDNIEANRALIQKYAGEVLKTFNVIQTINEVDESDDSAYAGSNSSESYLQDSFSIDSKITSPASIKILIATLQEAVFEVVGSNRITDVIDRSTGLQKMVDYSSMFNRIMSSLAEKNTYQEKMDELQKLSETHPNFVRLVNRLRLNDGDNVDMEEWILRVKFYTTFAKQRPAPLIQYIYEDGTSAIGRADTASRVQLFQENWLADLKQNPNLVTVTKQDEYILDKDKVLYVRNAAGQLVDKATDRLDDQLRFLSDLGIIYTPVQIDRFTRQDRINITNAIKSIVLTFKKPGPVRVSSLKSMNIGGPLNTLFSVAIETGEVEPESTHLNIQNKRVQDNILTNAVSRMVNDLNASEDKKELFQRLPHLRGAFSSDSIYLNQELYNTDGSRKEGFSLSVNYIQGTIKVESDEKIPTDKLVEVDRLAQVFNLNLVGNYYPLLPADAKTEFLISMKNMFNNGLDEKAIEQLYNYYLKEMELGGTKTRAFNFITSEQPLSLEKFTKEIQEFFDYEVDKQVQQFTDFGIITQNPTVIDEAPTFTFKGLSKSFLTDRRYDHNNLSEQQVKDIVAYRTVNLLVNNIEIQKIFFGDLGAYADPAKRWKSFLSPREQALYDVDAFNVKANELYNTVGGVQLERGDPGYHYHSDNLKTVTFYDVLSRISDLPGYEKINTTDAQAISTLPAYKEMLLKSGKWFPTQEQQYQYVVAKDRLLMEEDGIDVYKGRGALKRHDEALVAKGDPRVATFNPIKPIVSGFYGANPLLDKDSIYALTYEMSKGRSIENLYKRMLAQDIGYVIFESGRKVGGLNKVSMYDAEGQVSMEPFSAESIVPVSFKWFGIQTETLSTKDLNTIGTQISKLATVNLMSSGVPSDMEDKYTAEQWKALPDSEKEQSEMYNLIKKDNTLRAALSQDGYDRLMAKLGVDEDGNVDSEQFLNLIKDELTRRELNNNLRDALEIDPATKKFKIPLEALNNYEQIKTMVFSYVNKNIAGGKVNGGPKIQASGAGYSFRGARITAETVKNKKTGEDNTIYVHSGLKFYTKEEPWMEVLLPSWFGKKLRDAGIDTSDQEVLNKLLSTEEGKKILSGVGFRIPTQELNSVDVFRVVGFLPEYMGDMIVVPEALTAKAGSDFDVDKLNTYLKNVYVNSAGELKLVPYFGLGQEAKDKFKELWDKGEFLSPKDLVELDRIIEEEQDALYDDPSAFAGMLKNIAGVAKLFSPERITEEFVNRESVLNYRDAMLSMLYRASIENEYFQNMESIISRPENFERLVAPNNSDELMSLRDTLVGISEEEFGEGKYKTILSPTYMNRMRHVSVSSKSDVGIAASNQVSNALLQKGVVYLDPTRIENLTNSTEKKFLKKSAIINLPHNKVRVGDRFYATVSNSRDQEKSVKNPKGRFISDKISQYINGFVDVVKDVFIQQIGVKSMNAGTFLFLERVGVPTDLVVMFMNQPIIREYQKILEKKGQTFPYIDDNIAAVKDMFPVPEKLVTQSFPTQEQNKLFALLKGSIESYYKGDKKGTGQFNSMQRFILDEYLKYSVMSSNLFRMQQAVSYDNANLNNPYSIQRKINKTTAAETNNIFTAVQDVVSSTYMGTIQRNLSAASNTIAENFFVFTKGVVAEKLATLTNQLDRPFMKEEDFRKSMRKVEQSYISYLIQNSTGINNRIKELLIDKQSSLINSFRSLQNVLKKHPTSDLNNPIIKNIFRENFTTEDSTKNVRLIRKMTDVLSQNTYIAAMEELRVSPVPEVRKFYDDLLVVSFLQSGIAASPISFTEVIPVEDYSKYLLPAIENAENLDLLDDFINEDAFYRMNWKDRVIVPLLPIKYVDGIPVNIFSNQNLRGFVQSKKDVNGNLINPRYPVYKVYTNSKQWNSRYVVVSIGTKEKPEYALLKKVEYADGSPWLDSYTATSKFTGEKEEVFYGVYAPVNAWGDGFKGQEAYRTARQSVYKNNTLRVGEEISNLDIIDAIQGRLRVDTRPQAPVIAPTEAPTTLTDKQAQVEAIVSAPGFIKDSAKKHLPKELFKIRQATQFIGTGGENDSTTQRMENAYSQVGLANTGDYNSNDLIYISSNGNRGNRFVNVKDGVLQGVYQNVDKAIAAKAKFIMDTKSHLDATSGYNIGEVAMANYLTSRGYTRNDQTGVWSSTAPSTRPVANIPQNKVSGVESYGSLTIAAPNVIKALGPTPHSIDMIEAGFRTRTTRSANEMAKYRVNVGDVIKHFGKSADGTTKEILARVTAIHPKGTPGWKGTWTKEGWRAEDVNVIDRFKDGAAAIEFELIKPTAPSSKVEVVARYSDADVKANPNKIYVFGDNTQRKGTGGQAQIRNNPNAMGIATKLAPSMEESAFMKDSDLARNRAIIDADIAKIKATGKVVIFPKDGLGTGLAKLKEKAPQTYAYLKQRLLQEFGFDNDKGVITAPTEKTELAEAPVTETQTFTQFGTEYRFTLENGVVVSGEFKQTGRDWASLNPKNVQSKYTELSSQPSAPTPTTAAAPTTGVVEKTFKFADGTQVDVPFTLNSEQKQALLSLEEFVKNPKKFDNQITLLGYAGTGKTSIISIFDKYLNRKYITPVYTSPTHRANAVTKQKNPTAKVVTLHSLFGLGPDIKLEEGDYDIRDLKFARQNKPKIQGNQTLIVDEASMVSTALYDFLENFKDTLDINIIYVGDPAQLKPVKDTNISPVFTKGTKLQLTKVERTGDNPILRESTELRNGKDFSYITDITPAGGVEYINDINRVNQIVGENFSSKEFKDNALFFRVLSATNKEAKTYNDIARKLLFNTTDQLVKGDVLMGYNNFDVDYATGEPLIVNSGDYKVESLRKSQRKMNIENQDVVFSGYDVGLVNLMNPSDSIKNVFIVDNNESRDKILKFVDEVARLNKAGAEAKKKGEMKTAARYFEAARRLEANLAFMKPLEDANGKLKVKKTLDYGYAHTIHKSQGGTYNRVLILDNTIDVFKDPQTRQQLKYVAMSRASEMVYVSTTTKATQAPTQKVGRAPAKIPAPPAPAAKKMTIGEFYNSLTQAQKDKLGPIEDLVNEFLDIPFDMLEQDFINELNCRL